VGRIAKVLIVGGGIGGLSSAIALRRAGIEVDLVEINSSWTVYHVGVVMQGNALRALAALGIAEHCIAAGFPYDGISFRDRKGKLLGEVHGLPVAGPHLPTDLGIARPALHKVLSEAALDQGTHIRLGVTFSTLEQRAGQVCVTFTDASHGDYDVVIGADGVNSKLRALLFGDEHEPRFTGQSVWRYNVPRPPELDQPFFVDMPGGTAGFVPLTASTGYVLLVQSEPRNPRQQPEQLAAIFRSRLAICEGPLAQLREHIRDPLQVVYRPLYSIFMPPPWHVGRVLLIGDAVHATTPHLGQGAAQAIEDAVVLGELLVRDEPIEELFTAFLRRRFDRCKRIYDASLQIGEWEQHPTPEADRVALVASLFPVFAQPI
jgi:2-polyprenyl-6-methoxyphenol hydroxylase-like FAD-dependent oxidoreductase